MLTFPNELQYRVADAIRWHYPEAYGRVYRAEEVVWPTGSGNPLKSSWLSTEGPWPFGLRRFIRLRLGGFDLSRFREGQATTGAKQLGKAW